MNNRMEDNSPSSEEELKSRIEGFFNTKDKEMWQLGRLLCHHHRINYWVYVDINRKNLIKKRELRKIALGKYTSSHGFEMYDLLLIMFSEKYYIDFNKKKNAATEGE